MSDGLELRGKTYWLNFKYNKKRIHETTRTTHKAEALKVLMKRKMELMAQEEYEVIGSSVQDSDVSFREASALAWENHIKHLNGADNGFRQIKILNELIGDRKVSTIDESVFSYIAREIPKRHGCKPTTVNHYFIIINHALKAARKILRAPCMPLSKVKLSIQKKVIKPVTMTEEEKILKWMNQPRIEKNSRAGWKSVDLVEIYEIGIATGMRRGELFGFTVDQMEGRVITLRPDQHKTGKNTGEKKIVLPPAAEALLLTRVERLKLGPKDVMFGYSKKAYTRLWERMKVDIGVTGRLTPHSMRHAFATRKISKGMSIYHVSKLLGHTTVKTTEMYAKVDQSELLNVMEKYA